MFVGVSTALTAVRRVFHPFIREGLKLYYRFTETFSETQPDFLLDGSTSFGNDDKIDLGTNTFNIGKDGYSYSISAWFKAPDQDDNSGIFSSQTSSSSEFQILLLASGRVHTHVYDGSTQGTVQTSTDNEYNDSQWHHVVSILDSSADTLSLYVDGSLIGSTTWNMYTTGSLVAHIGSRYASSNYFEGRIANVGIWDRALSASEVESIYWRGSHSELQNTELTNLVSWYDLNSTSFGSDVITNGDDWTGASGSTRPTGWSGSGGGSPTHTIVDLSSVNNFDSSTLRFTADGVRNIFQNVVIDGARYKVEFAYRTDSSSNYIYVGNSLNTIALSNTGLSGDATVVSQEITSNGGGVGVQIITGGSTIEISYLRVYPVSAPDSEGTNNGTIVGATTNSDSCSGESPFKPRIQDIATPKMAVQLADGSTSFDGSNDYISISTSASSNWTFSVWAKAGFTDSSWHELYDKNPSSGGRITIAIVSNKFQMYDTAYRDSGYTLSDKNWHHYVITQTGTALNFYVDGSHQATVTGSGHSLGGDAHIGRYYPLAIEYWNGSMANVALYSSALTQSQIQELMFTEKYSGLSADLKTNLVSWYDMGSSTNPHNDLEGSNHGTNNGATVNTGYTHSPHGVVDPLNFGEVYSGRALDFDGNVDYIELGTSSSLDINAFTISTWVKFDSVTEGTIFGEYLDGNNYSTVRIISGKVYSYGFTGGDVWEANTSGTITTGQWYHIAITIGTDTSTPIIYIDGVAVGLENVNGSAIGTAKRIGHDTSNIGRWFPTIPRYLDGKVSSFKIFNTNITQAQVQELYTNPEQILPTGVSASNLKLDLPMQEGSGSYVYDGSGNQNHGTITGATWVSGEEYGYQASLVRSNTPMIFDGSDDYVDCVTTNMFQNATNMSISAWIFPTHSASSGDNFYSIITQFDASAGERSWGLWLKAPNNSTDAHIFFYDNTSSINTTSAIVPIGKWSHIVLTRDGTSIKVYFNGSLNYSTTSGASANANFNTKLLIGAQNASSPSAFFEGFLNEISLHDITLDADAVTALYNSGVPLLPTSDSGNYDNSSNLVGYWRNDGNTWTDRSTNSNNGTASGSPVSILIPEGSTEGRDNQGYYLSDTTTISNGIRLHGSEYIEIQDSEVLSFGDGTDDRPFSLEAWIKMDDPSSFMIFTKGQYNISAEYNLYTDSSDKLNLTIYDESLSATYRGKKSNTALSSGQWIHVVATYDGTGGTNAQNGINLYINGSVVSDTDVSNGSYVSMENLGADLMIGKDGAVYTKGIIDEARVYSKELSASEVLKNYNSGKSSHQ